MVRPASTCSTGGSLGRSATGARPSAALDAALAARPDLDRDRVEQLARFKQATAASYYLTCSIDDPALTDEAALRLRQLGI